MSRFTLINGKILTEHEPSLMVSNRSFRYGDGFFETMKLRAGEPVWRDAHFERFFQTATTLGYVLPTHFDNERLKAEIIQLAQKNNCSTLARIRLSAWRGDGGLLEGDDRLHYAIECWPLDPKLERFNENGLVLGVFPFSKKACDAFSHLKTASFLPYSLAARFARSNKWNDALVLNTHDRIADSTIANIFLIRDGEIITPPLSEGPIAGIFRQRLMNMQPVIEVPLTQQDLETADEIFLTNSIRGIKWVHQLGDRTFSNKKTKEIYAAISKTFLF